MSSEQKFQLVILTLALLNMKRLAQQYIFDDGGKDNNGLGYPRREDLVAAEH